MDRITDKIRQYMSDNCMTDPGDEIVLGVSGGADSMCLLFALWEIFSGQDITLRVVHVNHMIRGEEADRDAQVVKNICEKLNVPCRVVTVDCLGEAKRRGESPEEAGRHLRYETFLQEKADVIAVAHHMDDQAETILANLIRGSFVHGLSGMSPVSEYEGTRVIRPLLCLRRSEIEKYLTDKGCTWCEDRTNEENVYSRNRIRHEIIPQMRKINEKADEHICRLADDMRELSDHIRKEAKAAYDMMCISEKEDEVALDCRVLEQKPDFLKKEILRLAIEALAGGLKDITAVHVQQLLLLCENQSGRRMNLPYGITAERSQDSLLLYREVEDDCDKTEPQLPAFSQKVFALRAPVDMEAVPGGNYTKWFDYDKIPCDVILRTRQPGDYIVLSGGTKKIKDYFIDEKIPRRMRDRIPLLVCGNEVLWIVGYRINHRMKVSEQTERILECTIAE